MARVFMKKLQSLAKWLIPFFTVVFLLFGCGSAQTGQNSSVPDTYTETSIEVQTEDIELETDVTEASQESIEAIDEFGSYTTKEDVALYIHMYGCLPENFITKKEAEELGWVRSKGNLWEVAPGMSIGGSRFGNNEGLLPDKKGRKWFECDINYDGISRGAERIVYSDDGLIYYTADHYKSFEQLY